MWNEFIELPEHQQEHIVKIATDQKKIRQEKKKKRVTDDTTTNSCSSDENFETFVLIENRTTINDNQSTNPLHRQGNFIYLYEFLSIDEIFFQKKLKHVFDVLIRIFVIH
jgi:hypothetical protein